MRQACARALRGGSRRTPRRRLRLVGLAALLWPAAAPALDLALPASAILTREVAGELESHAIPVGPYADGILPTLEVEGRLRQQAWRIEAQAITTLQMLTPLRAQLIDAGYDILLDCAGAECGGFDFRFATRVMPAPDMFVDLFNYHFVSARRQGAGEAAEYVSLMVSRSSTSGYIQIIQIAPKGSDALNVTRDAGAQALRLPAVSDLPVAEALIAQGHAILSDLNFETGSSELGPGPFASLRELAAVLKNDAGLRVALVGHTDAVGELEPNIGLSKRRAASVLERLVGAHGVSRAQLAAEGMGYLAPIAPNLTQDGREANRRVEAVLLNSE